MKKNVNEQKNRRPWGRPSAKMLGLMMGALTALSPSLQAEIAKHDIAAAKMDAVQHDPANHNALTVTISHSVNDLRLRSTYNGGDYDIQIGEDATDDSLTGVVMSSVAANGRDNGNGTLYAVSAAAFNPSNTNGYFIPIFSASGLGAGNNPEFNTDIAAAWFPYASWLGGFAYNTANGGALTEFISSPELALGVHFIDNGSGRSVVDLTSLGIDSRTDGILLVTGAKNESANFGLGTVNLTNGTWNLFIKDVGQANINGFEQDGIAFVFIPKTNTTVISGRFLGDGSIAMHSDVAPQFTVANLAAGQYELKIPGRSPTNGVLIISNEGGGEANVDNFASYQVNGAGDGWIIESRDVPGAALEALSATEGVVSFAYIPISTPGFTVFPTNNLLTSENGDTAVFTVRLDTAPTSDVVIGVTSSNPLEGTVDTATLTFTPFDWNVPQTVTITGQDDVATDGSVAYTVVLSPAFSDDPHYSGRDPVDVAVVNADNEGGITVSPTSGLVTTEAGGQATFTIRLNTQPSANVTVNLSSSDETEGTVSPASVVFTSSDWSQEQTVTVTGVQDLIDDGDVAYTIVTAPATSADATYNGRNALDVSVTNTDDDIAGLTVSAGPLGLSIPEGQSTNYTVVLNTEPANNVTVTVVSTDTTQGGTVSPSTLTFTPLNWFTPQAVTITAINDTALDGHTSFSITNTASGDAAYAAAAPVSVSVTTLDNEPSLTLPSGDLYYRIGVAGIGIDGAASLVDENTPGFNGAVLTVTLTSNGTADDRLEVRNTGTEPGQVSVSGNTISYGGVAVATFAGGSGTTPLTITFNNASTPEAAQAVLRSVTFCNVNSEPSLNRREVSVVLQESDGGNASATTGVRVGLIMAADFQEGVDRGFGVYHGVGDIHLQQANPNNALPAGGNNGLFIDYPLAGEFNAFQTLLRFDNIVGDGFGQIPSDAIIISADLIVNLTDTGHGSPLYRMLQPFDATNEMWATSNGVDQDDFESRSTYESQFGLPGGVTSGIGTVNIGVTPDIRAWVNGGEPNYGWVMPGWIGQGNGTGFSPSETADPALRPRLRVLWVPAGTASASFRQGVNEYSGAQDTRIRANAPDEEASAVTGMHVDWAVQPSNEENHEQILIRFDDIIGNGEGQIPAGSQIHAAVLDLAGVIGNAPGDGGTFHALLKPWDHVTSTWNFWENGIQADNVDAVATPTTVAGNETLAPNVQATDLTYDLTSDVQAWVSGARPNYGWAILPWPNGGDGWGFATSEAADENDRPTLRVYYTPGTGIVTITMLPLTRTQTDVTIRFSALPESTYSVQRAETINGTWNTLGTATTGQDGVATFVDNAPLPNTAFYRVSNP